MGQRLVTWGPIVVTFAIIFAFKHCTGEPAEPESEPEAKQLPEWGRPAIALFAGFDGGKLLAVNRERNADGGWVLLMRWEPQPGLDDAGIEPANSELCAAVQDAPAFSAWSGIAIASVTDRATNVLNVHAWRYHTHALCTVRQLTRVEANDLIGRAYLREE